jgi:hypothetical protein
VNCRSSRETAFLAIHPAHVVHKWISHTARVARQHYLQVTNADFDRAAGIFGTVSAAHEPSRCQKTRCFREKCEMQQSIKYPRQGSNL